MSAHRTFARVAWVDAAKGMSILLVVMHHAVMFLQTSGMVPPAVVAANTALASMRMPLFFLASGMFVAGPLAAPWRTLLHKRVAFFLYLFAIWTLIRFAFFHIPAVAAVDPYVDDTDPVALALSPVIPGSGVWFLYALALYAVVGKLSRAVPAWLQLGVAGVLSALVAAEAVQLGDEMWDRMARYLVFFLLGWHARHLIERLAAATSALRVVVAAGACVTGAVAAVAFAARWLPGVALALNLLALTFGVLFAAWICRYRVGRPLVALGARTLPVYLIHVFWVAVLVVGLRHVPVPEAAGYVLPVVMALVCTALSLLTHRALVAVGAPWLFALPARLAHREPAHAAR